MPDRSGNHISQLKLIFTFRVCANDIFEKTTPLLVAEFFRQPDS
jgi:hypothetical protein